MKKNIFLKIHFIMIATMIVLTSFGFLFLSERNIIAQEEEDLIQEIGYKCLIDPEVRNGFENGKIPIGELVDYSEFFGAEVLKNLNIIVSNTKAAISNADKLTGMSTEFKCGNCEIECRKDCDKDDEGNKINCVTVCWCDNFNKLMAKARGFVSAIKTNLKKIIKADENIYDLAHAEGPLVEENQPLNRWKLILTLTDSRNKLENCLMGYTRVLEDKRATATLLSCMIALDKISLAELLIVPGFDKFISKPEEVCFDKLVPDPSQVCYPYNSEYWLEEDQRNRCKQNKDSLDCQKTVGNLMYNFFCCIEGI
jgi:hypothetical protein